MRYFNTSGPNIASQHYTLQREAIIEQGLELVSQERYFTIWAPRQTGKSTYFRQLAVKLEEQGYKVAYIDCKENNDVLAVYRAEMGLQKKSGLANSSFETGKINNKSVIIWDNFDSLEKEFAVDLLIKIRTVFHERESHGLKSMIISGIENIFYWVLEKTEHSVFNIADNLHFPYFTEKEVFELLHQHEEESGQLFEEKAKAKIYQITAGQPGLVNGFAKVMVDRNKEKKVLDYGDYLVVEDWYLTEAIDKNFANILNQARKERVFVERLLFTEDKIPFDIDRESIKLLHTNGLIKKDAGGNVVFWVPFYKKRLYKAFYPYTNGEKKEIAEDIYAPDFFDMQGKLKLGKLIGEYKKYVKRRSFKVFLEKDENGKYKSIKESALIYSFETFISAVVSELKGKIYREADTGLGKSDMIINFNKKEYLIETKVYYSQSKFTDGKKQLAYYCNSLSLTKGVYLVFCPKGITYPEAVKEQTETIANIEISTWLVEYDEDKW